MKLNILGISATVLLTLPALSQTESSYPPGYLKTEANSYYYFLGGYKDGRYQLLNGGMRGTSFKLSQVGFRADWRPHSVNTGMGRSFTQVTLQMAEFNWNDRSSTFTTNLQTNVKQVFQASVSWPKYDGTPAFKPVPWETKLAFPFSTEWTYTGTKDLIMDFVFEGGKLTNGGAWSGGTQKGYYLDCQWDANYLNSIEKLHPTKPAACRDTADPQNTYANSRATAAVYGNTYSNVDYAGKLVYRPYAQYIGPNSDVWIMAVTAAGDSGGFAVGARCNKLYLDLSGWFYMAVGFNKTNSSGYTGTYEFRIPWQTYYAGQSVWLQTAWEDTKTKQFSLSTAWQNTLPITPRDRFVEHIYHYVITAKNGWRSGVNANHHYPVFRMLTK